MTHVRYLDSYQIAELARLSADHLIRDAVAGPLVSAEKDTLLVALQLDEAADEKNEKVRCEVKSK